MSAGPVSSSNRRNESLFRGACDQNRGPVACAPLRRSGESCLPASKTNDLRRQSMGPRSREPPSPRIDPPLPGGPVPLPVPPNESDLSLSSRPAVS